MKSRRPVNSDVGLLALMKRRISSLLTLPLKLLNAPIGVLLITGLDIEILKVEFPMVPTALIFAGTLALLLIGYWYFGRLKFVSIDDTFLYVSGWFDGMRLSLSEIDSVSPSIFRALVLVRLKSPSRYGRTIPFIPIVGRRAIVEELRSLRHL